MNIMENIWAYLSKEIYNQGPLKNLRDLQWRLKNVVASFNETQSVMVKNLYQSISTRLFNTRKAWTTLKVLDGKFNLHSKKSYGQLCNTDILKSLYHTCFVIIFSYNLLY